MACVSDEGSLFDTHCHLDFSAFELSRQDLLQRCQAVGIARLMIPSTTRESWSAVGALMSSAGSGSTGLSCAFGLHPYFISGHSQEDLSALAAQLQRVEGCVALGEIGLDASREDMAKQERFFVEQLKLARQFELPVIVHSFKTHSRVYKLIKEAGVSRGVIHAFSGSKQEAERFIELGLHLGIGPVITWPGSRKTRATVAELPLDSLVLETDAPDMPVQGKRKGEGSPLDVIAVFDALCKLRAEPEHLLRQRLWQNSCSLFGLKKV